MDILGSTYLPSALGQFGLIKRAWSKGLLSLTGVQAMLIVGIIELWRVPGTDFINPTISRSEFVVTNTIPVSLTMPTFSWHRVWPPVISQQKLASTTQWWSKTASRPQTAECIHAEINSTFQRHPQKFRRKGKARQNAESPRGASNPLGQQTPLHWEKGDCYPEILDDSDSRTMFWDAIPNCPIRCYPYKKYHLCPQDGSTLSNLWSVC